MVVSFKTYNLQGALQNRAQPTARAALSRWERVFSCLFAKYSRGGGVTTICAGTGCAIF